MQPFASVTVRVCVPAESPAIRPVPEYGAVPPEALTEADPSEPPLQVTSETKVQVATMTAGSVIVTEQEAVQPFASEIL